jgi:peptide/nickel transport system substrate-binding protein
MAGQWVLAALAIVVALHTGCAATPRSSGPASGGGEAPKAEAPKRLLAAIMGDAHTVAQKLNPASYVPGIDTLEELVSAGLTNTDDRGNQRAQLAEAAPTVDNGRWKLQPDGRMEMAWTIRPGAQWHDGAPFTTDDLLFTMKVVQDPDLGVFRDTAFGVLEGVEASDARTVVARWKAPLVRADQLFSRSLALPLPKHLLERPYEELEKPAFLEIPHWSHEFVGSGPYRLREFARGSHLILEANERWVLGKPRVDTIEVKFIPDSKTLVANILAGAAELTLGRSISLEEGLQLRDQWRDGGLFLTQAGAIQLHPQFLNANPPVIGKLQFRRALYHAIDRQELGNSLQAGEATVAHTFVVPNQAEYASIEGAIVRYDYDPRRAGQMLEGLGYSRASDGFLRDPQGQRLPLEVIGAGGEANLKSVPIVADFWRRVGVEVSEAVVPIQRQRDYEWTANFPGFELSRRGADLKSLLRYHRSQAPTAERGFQGQNVPRYINADLDALIERYHVTIPIPERMSVLGQIVNHMSEQLVLMTLFYDKEVTAVANRLVNFTKGLSSTQAWNAEQWDLR